ncbi:MAG: DUF4391 domain-containing protein [Elusimicrobiales bacterium]|nr:DUF4391 domain-containing protein [Elusimicrobiales bacterium]
MKFADILAALALPNNTAVNQRIPKKLLLENGAPTASDKRSINEGIEEMSWLASLKPSNIAVPEIKTDDREYLEIAVASMCLRPKAKSARLVELMHRSIPYPLVLISEQEGTITLSLAHKRISKNESGQMVLDSLPVTETFGPDPLPRSEKDFLAAIALASQPAANLFTLYQGWLDRMADLSAARVTGSFAIAPNTGCSDAKRAAFAEYVSLKQEIAVLRAQTEKETQLSRRAEMNLAIHALETRMRQILALFS